MERDNEDDPTSEKEVSDAKSNDSPIAEQSSVDLRGSDEKARVADEEKAPEQTKPAGPGPPPNGGMY